MQRRSLSLPVLYVIKVFELAVYLLIIQRSTSMSIAAEDPCCTHHYVLEEKDVQETTTVQRLNDIRNFVVTPTLLTDPRVQPSSPRPQTPQLVL